MALLLQYKRCFTLGYFFMYKQAVILLLMLFTASVSAALPARYMQTIENAAIWAQIGDKMVTVGNIRAGQIIAVPQVITHLILALVKGLSIKGISSQFRGDKKLKTVWVTSTSR